jgi:NAD(P)-dependent dehydrogenase (short-subunit alcohol dehydrogenase family)
MTAFRSQLLAERAVALAGPSDAVRHALAALGARVEILGDLPVGEDRVGDWARERGGENGLQAVIFDASPAFAQGGPDGLRAACERAWTVVREVATGSLIPAQEGGKVVLIGPLPDAGPCAGAARSALENLARTLAIEWARHGVTATMIAPGATTIEAQVAQLVCYLISAGGDYFSGCRFSLGDLVF